MAVSDRYWERYDRQCQVVTITGKVVMYNGIVSHYWERYGKQRQ